MDTTPAEDSAGPRTQLSIRQRVGAATRHVASLEQVATHSLMASPRKTASHNSAARQGIQGEHLWVGPVVITEPGSWYLDIQSIVDQTTDYQLSSWFRRDESASLNLDPCVANELKGVLFWLSMRVRTRPMPPNYDTSSERRLWQGFPRAMQAITGTSETVMELSMELLSPRRYWFDYGHLTHDLTPFFDDNHLDNTNVLRWACGIFRRYYWGVKTRLGCYEPDKDLFMWKMFPNAAYQTWGTKLEKGTIGMEPAIKATVDDYYKPHYNFDLVIDGGDEAWKSDILSGLFEYLLSRDGVRLPDHFPRYYAELDAKNWDDFPDAMKLFCGFDRRQAEERFGLIHYPQPLQRFARRSQSPQPLFGIQQYDSVGSYLYWLRLMLGKHQPPETDNRVELFLFNLFPNGAKNHVGAVLLPLRSIGGGYMRCIIDSPGYWRTDQGTLTLNVEGWDVSLADPDGHRLDDPNVPEGSWLVATKAWQLTRWLKATTSRERDPSTNAMVASKIQEVLDRLHSEALLGRVPPVFDVTNSTFMLLAYGEGVSAMMCTEFNPDHGDRGPLAKLPRQTAFITSPFRHDQARSTNPFFSTVTATDNDNWWHIHVTRWAAILGKGWKPLRDPIMYRLFPLTFIRKQGIADEKPQIQSDGTFDAQAIHTQLFFDAVERRVTNVVPSSPIPYDVVYDPWLWAVHGEEMTRATGQQSFERQRQDIPIRWLPEFPTLLPTMQHGKMSTIFSNRPYFVHHHFDTREFLNTRDKWYERTGRIYHWERPQQSCMMHRLLFPEATKDFGHPGNTEIVIFNYMDAITSIPSALHPISALDGAISCIPKSAIRFKDNGIMFLDPESGAIPLARRIADRVVAAGHCFRAQYLILRTLCEGFPYVEHDRYDLTFSDDFPWIRAVNEAVERMIKTAPQSREEVCHVSTRPIWGIDAALTHAHIVVEEELARERGEEVHEFTKATEGKLLFFDIGIWARPIKSEAFQDPGCSPYRFPRVHVEESDIICAEQLQRTQFLLHQERAKTARLEAKSESRRRTKSNKRSRSRDRHQTAETSK